LEPKDARFLQLANHRVVLEEALSPFSTLTEGTTIAVEHRGKYYAMLVKVRVFRQKFTLEDAIGSHACSLEANTRVTNGIPLGSSLLLPVCTVNCVQTLKVKAMGPEPSCSILNTDLAVDLVPMLDANGQPIHIPDGSNASADAAAHRNQTIGAVAGAVVGASGGAGAGGGGGAAGSGEGAFTLEVPVNDPAGLDVTLAAGYSTFRFAVHGARF
jgi:hypothetical protein